MSTPVFVVHTDWLFAAPSDVVTSIMTTVFGPV